MRASGSNSVAFDDVFVPVGRMAPPTWAGETPPERTGSGVHGNPMYIGTVPTFLRAQPAAVDVCTARPATHTWTELPRTPPRHPPPFYDRQSIGSRTSAYAPVNLAVAR